jgi:NtrC-family two-component system sensor histidine kinase KinB
MRIKLKLAIGLVFMFLFTTALVFVSIICINRLSLDSSKIIKDNYASLEYCREMQKSIDRIHQHFVLNASDNSPDSLQLKSLINDTKKSIMLFEKYLSAEENNITEQGEKSAVENLRNSYEDYIEAFSNTIASPVPLSRTYMVNMNLKYNAVKNSIIEVFNTNLNAMNQKSKRANNTGENALIYVSILGTVTFVISFTFLLNFPGAIGNPIIEITTKIKEVANRNYDERIIVNRRDELGEMAMAFNTMAERLKEYEKSTLAELLTEKSRVEAIIKNLDEGIILLDEEHRIKVINPVAAQLLNIIPVDVIDRPASEVAMHNDLFRELIRDLVGSNQEKSGSLRITLDNEENFFIKEIFKVKRLWPKPILFPSSLMN